MRGLRVFAAVVVMGTVLVGIVGAQRVGPGNRIMPVRRAPEPDAGERARFIVGVLEEEVVTLAKEGTEKAAKELSAKVAQWKDELAGREVAARGEAELHVVGVYEGLFPDGPRKFGTAKVRVDVKDRPVVLALCAYSPVRWEVAVGEGVKVERIILSGHGEQEIVEGREVPVERHDRKAGSTSVFYTHKTEGEAYQRAQEVLRALTELSISTFTGSYRAPEQPIVLGPGNESWRHRRVMAEAEGEYLVATALDRARRRESVSAMKYGALTWEMPRPMMGIASFGQFEGADVVEGSVRELPRGVKAVAVDPAGPTHFAISWEAMVRVDLAQKAQVAMPIEGDIPELSHPCGITFDTKRRRALLASMGGVGYLYSYEPDRNRWSLLGDMNNIDLTSLSYSLEEDCLYGLAGAMTEDYETVIHRFDADGAWQEMKPLPKRVQYDRSMLHSAPMQVAAVGTNLAVLWGTGDEMRMMVIDWKTNGLVYEGPVKRVVRGEVGEAELERMWERLGVAPEDEARGLVMRMAAGGRGAVELIKRKLPRVEAVDDQEAKDESPGLRREVRAMRVLGEVGGMDAARALRDFATEGGTSARVRAAREMLKSL